MVPSPSDLNLVVQTKAILPHFSTVLIQLVRLITGYRVIKLQVNVLNQTDEK